MNKEEEAIVKKHKAIIDASQSVIDSIKNKYDAISEAEAAKKKAEKEADRIAKLDEKRAAVITHGQVLTKEHSWDEYMAQFVTEPLKRMVLCSIGLDVILKSNCSIFNDTDINAWRNISHRVPMFIDRDLYALSKGNEEYVLGSGSFYWSESSGVSIAKHAAKQIRKEHQESISSSKN